MAIVDLEFNEWMRRFRALNPELFNGRRGLSERAATDIAQYAFSAGKAAGRMMTAPAPKTNEEERI